MPEPIKAIAIAEAALTPSEKERAEQLVWTTDGGRGWKMSQPNASDRQILIHLTEDLEGRLKPASRAFVVRELARLANHFRTERPADAWQMLFEDYFEDLDGISEAHLREVLASYRRQKPYFPKTAELLELWRGVLLKEEEKLRRARVILKLETPRAWEREAIHPS